MSGPLRSKQGCWTCRLRKKKCDELHPHCSTCKALSITCYGFGQKPEWIDNAEKRKQVVANLKELVKQTSRHKLAAEASRQHNQPVLLAPKPSNAHAEIGSSEGLPSQQNSPDAIVYPDSLQADNRSLARDGSTDSNSAKQSDSSGVLSISTLNLDDSILLMHYLDNVFPLQYPAYRPRVAEGGRGWLLSFLLRIKEFYHASLALSAYHRQELMSTSMSGEHQIVALSQLEKHMELCLVLLRQSAHNSCKNNPVGIMASVVQLVFFELFTGNDEAWKAHLAVALTMCEKGLTSRLLQSSRDSFSMEDSNSQYERADTEVISLEFLRGTIFWLDIIFSITAGTAPSLLPYHSSMSESHSQTRLEDIMGCSSWVMIRIGRIAALQQKKSQAILHGYFDDIEFERTVFELGEELQNHSEQEEQESLYSLDPGTAATFDMNLNIPIIITRIFTKMAFVYIHLVANGFQKLESLDTHILETIKMVKTMNSSRALSALVCPLFVIGCVASQSVEVFFRDMFSTAPLSDPCLRHRRRLSSILDMIWSKRKARPDLTWQEILYLIPDILLL